MHARSRPQKICSWEDETWDLFRLRPAWWWRISGNQTLKLATMALKILKLNVILLPNSAISILGEWSPEMYKIANWDFSYFAFPMQAFVYIPLRSDHCFELIDRISCGDLLSRDGNVHDDNNHVYLRPDISIPLRPTFLRNEADERVYSTCTMSRIHFANMRK